MSLTTTARSGYTAASTPIRTARGTEYAVFAQVTHRMKAVDPADRSAFPRLAEAVMDNQRLWSTLAEDLLLDTNGLPVTLRAQLLSLAEFVRSHSLVVLAKRGSIAPLIDINTSIMKGLRGNAEAAA
jgi:flagellar biosynthesis activator protein FlaF